MAKTSTIGRLAVALDLDSAQFSQKINKTKKETTAFGETMKAGAKMTGTLAAGLGTIALAHSQLSAALRQSVDRASDFNNLLDDGSRGALLAYGEAMDVLEQESLAATDRALSHFTQLSYDVERIWVKLQKTIAPDKGSDFIITEADTRKAIEAFGMVEEEYKKLESRVKGSNSSIYNKSDLNGDSDRLQEINQKAKELAKARTKSDFDNHKRRAEIVMEFQTLGYERQILGTEKYLEKKRLLEQEDIKAQIALANNPEMVKQLEYRLVLLQQIAAKELVVAAEKIEKKAAKEKKAEDASQALIVANIAKKDEKEKKADEASKARIAANMDTQLNMFREKTMTEEQILKHRYDLEKINLEQQLIDKPAYKKQLDEMMLNLDQEYVDKQNEILNQQDMEPHRVRAELNQTLASSFQNVATAMGQMGMADTALGKGINIAAMVSDTVARVSLLMADAGAKSMAELPFPANMAAYGMIATTGASIMSSIKGIAHSGLDRVPSEGTYLLDKDEAVLNKQDAQAVRSGDGLPGKKNNAAGGESNPIQNISINPVIQSSGRDPESEAQLIQRMSMQIINDIRSNGQIGKTIRSTR